MEEGQRRRSSTEKPAIIAALWLNGSKSRSDKKQMTQ